LIEIIWQDHDATRRKLIEHGSDGGHAGGERHGFARLEPANDFFECFPGRRAIIAGVFASSADDEVRGGDQRYVQGGAGRGRSTRGDEPGFRCDIGREKFHSFKSLEMICVAA
jgi:hypothetical protein